MCVNESLVIGNVSLHSTFCDLISFDRRNSFLELFSISFIYVLLGTLSYSLTFCSLSLHKSLGFSVLSSQHVSLSFSFPFEPVNREHSAVSVEMFLCPVGMRVAHAW